MVDDNVRVGQRPCGEVRFEATLTDGYDPPLQLFLLPNPKASSLSWRSQGSAERGCADKLPLPHSNSAAVLLFSLRQIHPSSTTIQPETVCEERGLPLGVNSFDFPEASVLDGVNHTKDTGQPTRRAGVLRFIRSN
jgi:hypothetical protein